MKSNSNLQRTDPGSIRIALLGLFTVVMLAACGSAAAVPERPVDAGELGQQAERASALDGSYRLVFSWSLNEPGMRVSGRGVARIESPYRARLDLFTSNGERIVAAALVNDELRIPEGMPNVIPATPLLWASLGVFRPGPGVAPSGASLEGAESSTIRYRMAGGGELVARLHSRKLEHMEFRDGNGVRQEVRVVLPPDERFPREAHYRHHGEVRELRMTLEEIEHVETYPSDVWTPGG